MRASPCTSHAASRARVLGVVPDVPMLRAVVLSESSPLTRACRPRVRPGGGVNGAPTQSPQAQFTKPKRTRDDVSPASLGNGGGVPDRVRWVRTASGLTLPVPGQVGPARAATTTTTTAHASSRDATTRSRRQNGVDACTQPAPKPALPYHAPSLHPNPAHCTKSYQPPSAHPACRPTSRPTHSAAPLARLPRAPHR